MTAESLRVGDPRIERRASGEIEYSASIGRERLWFRIPADWSTAPIGDPFVVAGVLPAMRLGVPLLVDKALPVSPGLLENLHRLQQVFRLWGPELRQPFRMVPIDAAPAATARINSAVLSYFSGGVDGFHTLLAAPEPISHAVFSRGIDMQLDNELWDECYRRNANWLARREIPLVPVSTNIRFVGHAFGIAWPTYFGSGLAAIAHVLGAQKAIIAAGHTWRELWPDGSHPVTDPLWSSESTTIMHHGRGAMRWQKLERIAREPGVLEMLRVCWQDNGYNCGRCEKCLRTMALLRVLDLESPAFPSLRSWKPIARLTPGDRSEACFAAEAVALAEARGNRRAAGIFRRSLMRWYGRAALGGFKRKLFARGNSTAALPPPPPA